MQDSCSFEVAVSEADIKAFSGLSGDYNPLHNDAAYAATTEFGRRIAHGAFMVGLVSRVLGMHIPGTRSLILGMRVAYPKPFFFPGTLKVTGTLRRYDAEKNLGVVGVAIVDAAKAWTVLEAEVNFALHAAQGAEPEPARAMAAAAAPAAAGTPRVLVLGGTGGLGATVLARLKALGPVACVTRQDRAAEPGLEYLKADLDDAAAFDALLDAHPAAGFSAVVHLSSPPVARGFLSDDPEGLRRHLRQAVEVPAALARWARKPGSRVKRLVLVGSTYGTRFPKPHLGAYSLAKAAMEAACRLMTADLAAQGATVNVVAPTVVPAGLNEGMPERAKASLKARMPTGRLVEAADVAGVVEFLLSPASSQVNGTVIAVDGGLAD
ncbi:MAG: SDR family oxidoreductase [Elusimicrobia bacterium]|nr:SDR family oxidoreductase [Elusimicrobiota bacterium]